MSLDDVNQSAVDAILQSAELALREALAKHGLQHPEVLEKLEQYIELLRLSGKTDGLSELDETARSLRNKFETAQAYPASQVAPTAPPAPRVTNPEQSDGGQTRQQEADAPASGTAEQNAEVKERHLYSSRGKHIATEFDGHLYTPTGRHIGHWVEGIDVYVDRNGWYLGHVIDENRLAEYTYWSFHNRNFGDRGNAGDRPGWDYQRDTDRAVFPLGYQDIDVDYKLALHWRPRQVSDADGY